MQNQNLSPPEENDLLAQLRVRKTEIVTIATQYGASNIRVFGSVARGEADEKSDVDLLVVDQSRGAVCWSILASCKRWKIYWGDR